MPCSDDLLLVENYPRRPKLHHDLSSIIRTPAALANFNHVWFNRRGDEWHIHVGFGTVQPGDLPPLIRPA